jgi:hypothetical protein
LDSGELPATVHLARVSSRSSAGTYLPAATAGAAPKHNTSPPDWSGGSTGWQQPPSAIALHAETSALTAIGNDYGLGRNVRRINLASPQKPVNGFAIVR